MSWTIASVARSLFPRAGRPPRRAGRPRLEFLEGRDVPATPVGSEFTPHASTAGGQNTPAVAIDDAGEYVVVWVNKTSPAPYSAEDIFARRYDASGTALGSEWRVNTYTDYEQLNPAVASDADGDFIVVWQSNVLDFEGNGPGFEVRAQRYDSSGSAVGGEFTVNGTSAGDQTMPDVAMTPDGEFVVVWQTPVEQVRDGVTGVADQIYARRYDASGSALGGEFRVCQDSYGGQYNQFQYRPAVSAAADGAFAASWTSVWGVYNDFGGVIPYPDTTRIFARTFDDTGAAVTGQVMLHNPLTMEGDTDYSTVQENSDVAARRDGTGFVVAYDQSRLYGLPPWKDPDPFKANVFAVGSNWGATGLWNPIQVNAYYYGTQDNPAIAMDEDGNFVVTWQSAWAGAGSYPAQSDPGYGVYARQFTSAGVAVGGDFHVNTTQAGDQLAPAIAVDDDGHFVIVWYGVDTSGNHDVFGQRFDW